MVGFLRNLLCAFVEIVGYGRDYFPIGGKELLVFQGSASEEVDPGVTVLQDEDAVIIPIIYLSVLIQQLEALVEVGEVLRPIQVLCLANIRDTCQPDKCYNPNVLQTSMQSVFNFSAKLVKYTI